MEGAAEFIQAIPTNTSAYKTQEPPVMPPEYNHPSLKASARKKANHKIQDDHIRRQRGELACSECSRLKLKCDKKVPCSSCIRRCCSDICPHGHSNKRTTSRISPIMSERLQEKIRELTQRVRQLEDALAVLQATVSQEPHPLLNPKHQTQVLQSLETAHEVEREEIENNLGSLTIQDKKETFFGPTAGDETLFLHASSAPTSAMNSPDSSIEEQGSPGQSIAPDELLLLSEVFPFLPGGKWNEETTVYALLDFLPDRNRAWSLCETYFHQASWVYRMVLRDEAVNELLTPMYNHMKTVDLASPTSAPLTPHQISALFSIFSIGAYVDLTLSDHNQEAELYHKLALCAFALHSFYESPELATVQAACLLSAYLGVSSHDDRKRSDASWRYLSLACDIAHNIGLHRDPGRWGFNQKVSEKRRNVFWELCTANTYQALATGRPPHFHRDYIDCELPKVREDSLDESRDVLGSFWDWKHKFSLKIHPLIVELSLKTKAPSYDNILKLDSQLREFPLPSHPDWDSKTEDKLYLQRSYVTHVHIYPPIIAVMVFRLLYHFQVLLSQYKARVTVYLHRSYFVKAMLENPSDPLKSKYAPSFLTAFRSACEIIQISEQVYGWVPDQASRWWHFTVQLFSATIVVGLVAIRAPSPSMAKLAFEKLSTAVDLSSKMSKDKGRRARYTQAILERIHLKATTIYNQIPTDSSKPDGFRDDFDDAELRIFGGHTVVSQIESSKPPPPKPSLQSASYASMDTSNMPSQDPAVVYTDPQNTSDMNMLYNTNYMGQSHSFFEDISLRTSNYSASSYDAIPQHELAANPDNETFSNGNGFAEISWAELVAPVDPSFTTGHADESKMIDEYWTSLMRDAGVLNGFPTL